MRLFFPIVSLLAALTTLAPAANAYTVPNLVALATPDMQVAVTFAANPTPQTTADAGAFASILTDQYGLVPLANFEPTTNEDSMIVCEVPLDASELLVVYGIYGQGVDEATSMCGSLTNLGPVRWRLD